MKREPSIHISQTQFNELLKRLEIKKFPTEEFFLLASSYPLNSRVIENKNAKTRKRVEQVLLAAKSETQIVADIIYAIRIKLSHKGVQRVKQGSSGWQKCKELVHIIHEFSQVYKLGFREATIQYVSTGFEIMGSYYRNYMAALMSKSEEIFERCSLKGDLKGDENPAGTQKLYAIYNTHIVESTGIVDSEPLELNPEKYNHFLTLRRKLDERGWDYRIYLEAQFNAFEFFHSFPEPHQLYTSKAMDRYRKYVYRNSETPENKPIIKGSLWDKIKNHE